MEKFSNYGVEFMSFFLQTTDMDLGDTPIENIFINDYMPMANGTYVKVYLLGYKYAHDSDRDIEVNNRTISKHLDIPLEDVLSAWDFWEKKGIIEKLVRPEDRGVNYEVKFLNLKQLYIKNNIELWSEEKSYERMQVKDTKNLVDANKVPEVNNMFNNIDYMLRRETTPSQKQRILDWIYDFNMNPDVIEKAFDYSIEERGIKKIPYIEAIVRNWYHDGLTNMDALMEHFKKNDERYYRYQKVMKAMGLHRRPVKSKEMKFMDKWFEDWELPIELVLEACDRDTTPQPSLAYVDGILSSWREKGIKKVEDIEGLDKREKKASQERRFTGGRKGQSRKAQASVTRFHNFEQRTDKYSSDQLEDIAKKKRDAYNRKARGDS